MMGDVGSRVVETLGRALGRAQEQRPLPADLYESEDAFLAVFDAPGASPGDVQVKYEDNAVVVRVDRFREFYPEFEMQFPGRGLSFDGRVGLPPGATVDPESATATLEDDGTLRVHVPKTASADDAADADDSADGTAGDAGETHDE